MRKLVLSALSALVLFPMPNAAQSVFDGTWKTDLSNELSSNKPDVYVLQNGMYECKTCNPPFKVKADGKDQAISGNPYIDTVAIKVVSDHEIQETDKKGGKVVSTSSSTVSPDGKSLSFEFNDSSNTNGGPPVTGKGQATKVADGPAGTHAISGSWKLAKFENISDNGIVWTYKVNGNEITMTNPTGQNYTAKLDGTEAPMKGDPGVTSVSVKMLSSDTLQETDKRDGKLIGVMTMTAAGDGKSAKIKYEDKLQDRTFEATAVKQ